MEFTTLKILAFATLVAITCANDQDGMVDILVQNYKKEIDDMVVDQIQRELTASYIYQGYASYFQRADVSLPGIKKFFSQASLEERGHAESLIEYINKRGGHAEFENLDLKKACETIWKESKGDKTELSKRGTKRMCICGFVATTQINNECINEERSEWKEGLMAFEDALVVERYVNAKLLELHSKADAAGDAHLGHILEHDFLDEQVHAIYELGQHVTRLRSFASGEGRNYKLGEYIFDEHLQKSL